MMRFVRATRILYVENDPALRSLMTSLLTQRTDIDIQLATGSADEALASPVVTDCDAALIDLALGNDQIGGIDLGLALRQRNENIGIVIYSQYRLDSFARRVPESARVGWRTLAKTGEMSIEDVVAEVRQAALGINAPITKTIDEKSPLEEMTIRQRAVMGMVAAGVNTQEVARRLAISHAAVRQDLTRAYRLLVPELDGATELRTKAILAYLALTRDDDDTDGR